MNKCDVTSNYSPWAGTIIGVWRQKLIVKSFALLGPLGLCTSSKKIKMQSLTRAHTCWISKKERKRGENNSYYVFTRQDQLFDYLFIFFFLKKMKKRKTLLIPEIRQAICLIRKSHIAQIPVVPYERSGSVLGQTNGGDVIAHPRFTQFDVSLSASW